MTQPQLSLVPSNPADQPATIGFTVSAALWQILRVKKVGFFSKANFDGFEEMMNRFFSRYGKVTFTFTYTREDMGGTRIFTDTQTTCTFDKQLLNLADDVVIEVADITLSFSTARMDKLRVTAPQGNNQAWAVMRALQGYLLGAYGVNAAHVNSF